MPNTHIEFPETEPSLFVARVGYNDTKGGLDFEAVQHLSFSDHNFRWGGATATVGLVIMLCGLVNLRITI